MSQLLRFGLILSLICLIATAVLAVTYEITKPKIDEQLKIEEQSALSAILPEADSFEKKIIGDIEYFEAKRGQETTGYCIRVVGSGYSGFIRLVVGIDKDGIIKGVRILEHYETPGLGAKINEIRPGESEAWFPGQFVGKSANAITVKKDIDAITGATISSRAVSEAITKTVNDFLGKIKQ